jgi:hypothetical protein
MSYNDLDSSVQVNISNTLQVEYNLTAIERYLDIISNGVIFLPKDVDSSGRIRVWGSNTVDSLAAIYKCRDIESNVYIPFVSYIESIARITENNAMSVIYDLIQAPIIKQTNTVIQDVYTRQARPTLNYGTSQSLIVGNAIEGQYKTFIQVDLTNYNNLSNAFIIKANLILNLYGSFNPNTIIDVYEVNSSWVETNVTWSSSSSFSISSSPILSFSCSSNVVSIDVLDYINTLKLQEKKLFNVILKIRDQLNSTFSFFSKDAPDITVRPRIEIDYQELDWNGFLSQLDLSSSVSVRASDNRDNTSSTSIRRIDTSEVFGSVLVGRWEFSDVSSLVNVWKKNLLDSSVSISHTKDLNSEIHILDNSSLDMDSAATIIYYTNIDSSTTIIPSKNIDSTSNVRRTTFFENDGDATIQYALYLDSIANILRYKDLDSTSIIQYSKDVESLSNIISTINLSSLVCVLQHKDINSDASVQIYNKLDIDSQSSIKAIDDKQDMASSSLVILSNNLESQSNIKVYGQKDLSALSSIRNGLLQGLQGLESGAIIAQHKNKEITSYSTIQRSLLSNIDSSAIIAFSKDLEGDSNVLAKLMLDSIANIIYNKLLDSSVDTRSIRNLLSESLIRRLTTDDLEVEALFRQLDISEIDSEVYIMGSVYSQIDGNALIQRIRRDDILEGLVNIITNARKWNPSVHGKEVFKGVNGKLPRIWRKEDFIK